MLSQIKDMRKCARGLVLSLSIGMTLLGEVTKISGKIAGMRASTSHLLIGQFCPCAVTPTTAAGSRLPAIDTGDVRPHS